MPEPDSPLPLPVATRRPPRVGMLALGVLLAGLVAFFHVASGSGRSELGAHPDEAAHFVTGLMVRDYMASGFHESPLRYADDYYRHYPKIGLGNWPPVYYVAQAAWMLVFPAGVGTVLWLMSALGLGLAMATAWWLWREFGWIEAATGAILLTALPLVQQYSNMVMAEILSALFMFGAAGYFARYLEGAEWRGSLGFGLCAGLAIMTKGTGLALAFVPVLAIVFTGRYDLLKRASLWVAGLLVAVIAGPWTWHFRNQVRGGWEEASPSAHFTKTAIGFYGREMCVALGWLVTALAVAGVVSLFLPGRRKPAIAVCSLALTLGVWIFQCLTPVGHEARHLTPALPALMVLAMTGLRLLTEWRAATEKEEGFLTQRRRDAEKAGEIGREQTVYSRAFPFPPLRLCVSALKFCSSIFEKEEHSAWARPAIATGLLAVFFAWPAVFHPALPLPGYGSIGNAVSVSPFRIPRKEWGGFEQVAEAALATGPSRPLLIASDARGEGMFIAEVAARDTHRPSYIIERASKILASSTWSGSGYQSLYQTPGEVRDALAKAGIGLVVTDGSLAAPPAHEKLLMLTVEKFEIDRLKGEIDGRSVSLRLARNSKFERPGAVAGGGFALLWASTAVRDGRESPGAIELHSAPVALGNP